jgi:hypothetical protein
MTISCTAGSHWLGIHDVLQLRPRFYIVRQTIPYQRLLLIRIRHFDKRLLTPLESHKT